MLDFQTRKATIEIVFNCLDPDAPEEIRLGIDSISEALQCAQPKISFSMPKSIAEDVDNQIAIGAYGNLDIVDRNAISDYSEDWQDIVWDLPDDPSLPTYIDLRFDPLSHADLERHPSPDELP